VISSLEVPLDYLDATDISAIDHLSLFSDMNTTRPYRVDNGWKGTPGTKLLRMPLMYMVFFENVHPDSTTMVHFRGKVI
jgi:hypothetical protein